MNENKNIEGATWRTYRKQTATWAVKLPINVEIETPEGTVRASGGDYLAIDNDGHFYPIDREVFLETYEPIE